ncbi:MAG: hypothetical protein F6J90_10020 [Moorea sp. SIOASIH]|uniref:hypothetical protein n=1 Tax=Moorena sp. SIOASIH TaxID=2607817 RepID=UPI0013BE89AC|nr:hypothetical protein [Moorena sp. SIOASIH]NEO36640.1 hypothetical protein [Moorena sp. SIOASIH]
MPGKQKRKEETAKGETSRRKKPEKVRDAKEQARIQALRTADDRARKDAERPPRLLQKLTLPRAFARLQERVPSLSGDQIKVLSREQVQALGVKGLKALSAMQLKSLTPKQISALTEKQIKVLSRQQVRALDVKGLKALSAMQLKSLTPGQISALTVTQIKVLSATQLKSLTPLQIKALTVKQLKGMTDEQLQNLTKEQIESLDKVHMGAFSGEQLGKMTTEQVSWLSGDQLRGLNERQAPLLTKSFINSIQKDHLKSIPSEVLTNSNWAIFADLKAEDIRTMQNIVPKEDTPSRWVSNNNMVQTLKDSIAPEAGVKAMGQGLSQQPPNYEKLQTAILGELNEETRKNMGATNTQLDKSMEASFINFADAMKRAYDQAPEEEQEYLAAMQKAWVEHWGVFSEFAGRVNLDYLKAAGSEDSKVAEIAGNKNVKSDPEKTVADDKEDKSKKTLFGGIVAADINDKNVKAYAQTLKRASDLLENVNYDRILETISSTPENVAKKYRVTASTANNLTDSMFDELGKNLSSTIQNKDEKTYQNAWSNLEKSMEVAVQIIEATKIGKVPIGLTVLGDGSQQSGVTKREGKDEFKRDAIMLNLGEIMDKLVANRRVFGIESEGEFDRLGTLFHEYSHVMNHDAKVVEGLKDKLDSGGHVKPEDTYSNTSQEGWFMDPDFVAAILLNQIEREKK